MNAPASLLGGPALPALAATPAVTPPPPDPVTPEPGPPSDIRGAWLLKALEHARPDRVRRSPHAGGLILATVCIGAFMGQLDASIVTVALPHIGHALHAGVGAVEWVSLSYLLTVVALVAPIGAWADAVGRKALYLGGFGLFTVASAACAVAPNLEVLCVLRVLQAVGAALLQANSIALVASTAPRERLGRAIGVQSAAQAVGLALGPALGGLLLSIGSWRLLFIVNVPAGVIGIAAGILLLPRSRDLAPSRHLDVRGLSLFVPGICLVMLALSLASEPALRLGALPTLAVAAGVLALFHRQQTRAAAPLLDRVLLGAPSFRRGLIAGLGGYAVLFGVLVVVPFFLTSAHLASTGRIGLLLTALPIGVGVTAPFAGRLAERHGRAVAVGGLLLAAAALLALGALRPTAAVLAVLLLVIGVGIGAFTPANNAALMGAASAHAAGGAGGLVNMGRGLGTAAGTAIAALGFAAVAGAGASVSAAHARTGFTAVALALAVLALAAAAISPHTARTARNAEKLPGL